MSDVHISYTNLNQDFAEQVYKYLIDAGFTVWMDTHSLVPGTSWPEGWYQSLRESQILVLLLTPEAVNSANVRREWESFLVQDKPIITLVQGNDTLVPEELKKITYLKVNADATEKTFESLVDAVRKLLIPSSNQPEAIPNQIVIQMADMGMLTPEALSDTIMPFINALTDLQHFLDQIHDRGVRPVHIRRISQMSPITVDVGLGEAFDVIRKSIDPLEREKSRLEKEMLETEKRLKDLDYEKAKALFDVEIQQQGDALALETEKKRVELEKLRIENDILRVQLEKQRIEKELEALKLQMMRMEWVSVRLSPTTVRPISDAEALTMALELLEKNAPYLTLLQRTTYALQMKPMMENILASGVQFVPPPATLPP